MTEEPAGDTLVGVLSARAARQGARLAFSFLHRGERLSDEASFEALDTSARCVARTLTEAGLARRPVLLALPSDLDFVRCFLGCLYAGAYAAPAPPLDGRRGIERNQAILQDLKPAAAIVPSGGADGPAAFLRESGKVLTAAEALANAPATELAEPGLDDLAFIQYTSGSVGHPRGVVITHRNIMANQAMIREAFEHTPDDVMASWLPLHHDMGLIGSVLQPIYSGMRSVLLPPLAFLQKPLRWLRAIDAFRATVSGAPNFAYDLCTRLVDVDSVRSLDLSSWRLAYCGSEPVRADSLRRFAARFTPAGFSERAFYPCYGLAEATLFVSGGKAGTGFKSRRFTGEAVSCGRPFGNSQIIITNSQGEYAAPDETGEICITGDHVSTGYWSAADAKVHPDNERQIAIAGRPHLRTGDLGAIVDGELFVLGRSRDVIIVRGLKIHAEDVEATVLAAPHGGVLAAAAFAVEETTGEALVVVCEARGMVRGQSVGVELVDGFRAAVGEAHGILPRAVIMVPPGTIPRTSSGKIRRAACRNLYLAGGLLLPGQVLRQSAASMRAEAT